jgi:choline kinase
MQAVLLAAGLGSRLGALTRELPKALIPVGGKPLLAYAVAFAQAAGAREVVVVGGFGFPLVAAEVERRGLPVRLLENPAFRDGNLVSLLAARPAVEGGDGGAAGRAADLLVMNIDHIYRPAIAALAGAPADRITAFIDTDRELGSDDMKVERDPQGLLRRISKTLPAWDAGYVGMTKIPAAGR